MQIGETFELEGKNYTAVTAQGGCVGCAFRGVPCGRTPTCDDVVFVETTKPQHVGDSHEALTFHALPDTANPKDAAGRAKVPLHLWPASATAMGSVGLLEGELKYGRNNFRATPVAASVYVAACKRHLDAWMEGQDTATDTGSPHLGNALACLAIIVDTQANGTLIDDRNYVPNPGAYDRLVAELTAQCAKLKEMFKDKSPKHWDARDEVPL